MRIRRIHLIFESSLWRELALAWLRANGIAHENFLDYVAVTDISIDQLNRLNIIFENLTN